MKHSIQRLLFPLPLLASLALVACPSQKEATGGPARLTPVGVDVPEGQLMIINDPDTYFTFLLKGNNFENLSYAGGRFSLVVDGLDFQYTTVPISDFYDGNIKKVSDLDLLAFHQKYETDFLQSLVNITFNVYQQHMTFFDGRQMMFWTLESQSMPTQVLATQVIRPRIFLMKTTFETKSRAKNALQKSEQEITQMIISAMQSVERKDDPIDHKHLFDSVATVNGARVVAKKGKGKK